MAFITHYTLQCFSMVTSYYRCTLLYYFLSISPWIAALETFNGDGYPLQLFFLASHPFTLEISFLIQRLRDVSNTPGIILARPPLLVMSCGRAFSEFLRYENWIKKLLNNSLTSPWFEPRISHSVVHCSDHLTTAAPLKLQYLYCL